MIPCQSSSLGDVTEEELESAGIGRIQLQEQKITFTMQAGICVQIKVLQVHTEYP